MALNSGKIIVRQNWDFIPIPDTVISSINTLVIDQPKLLTFTDRRCHIIGDIETPGVGDNSDEGKVEFPGVDSELEEEDMEIPDIYREGNVGVTGVDMEGQDSPSQVVEVYDPYIPQD